MGKWEEGGGGGGSMRRTVTSFNAYNNHCLEVENDFKTGLFSNGAKFNFFLENPFCSILLIYF